MSKKTLFKRSSAMLLALLMCFSVFVGSTTTAFAATGETSQSYMVSYAKLYAAMPWEIVTVCRHSWSAKFGDAA